MRINQRTRRECVTLAALLFGSTTLAHGYEKLLDFVDDVRVGGDEYEWLWGHVFEDSTGYFIVRGTESTVTPDWTSQIVKVEGVPSAPTRTLLLSDAQWRAFTNDMSSTHTILPGRRMAVLGDYLQFLDVSTDAIYRIHTSTGELHAFVTNETIRAHTGLASARVIAASAFDTNGAMAFYDQDSDSVLLAEVNSSGELTTNGTVRTLISDAEFDALYAHSPINNVSGGMTYDAAGNLYWTTSEFSSTGPHTGSIYMRRASDGALLLVLAELDIQLATGDFGNVIFSDVFAAADGRIYFYDLRGSVDSILYFDPADPVNTLAVLLTESEMQAGPAGAVEMEIKHFSALGHKLVWNLRIKFQDLYAVRFAGLADFDGDGDVDLVDHASFVDCHAGPTALPDPAAMGVSPADCLDAFDFDFDGNVDLVDFSKFVVFFTG